MELRRLGVIWRGQVSLEGPAMGGAAEAWELEGPLMTRSEGLCFPDRTALVHSFPALERSCPVRYKTEGGPMGEAGAHLGRGGTSIEARKDF